MVPRQERGNSGLSYASAPHDGDKGELLVELRNVLSQLKSLPRPFHEDPLDLTGVIGLK